MAITKERKKEIVDKLQTIFTNSDSVVFVNFHGLTVEEITTVRKALRAAGIGYFVAKKTLTRLAVSNSTVEGEMPALEGELAVVFPLETADLGDDAKIAPAREIYAFQKQFEEKLTILGGTYEGKIIDQAAMMEVAQIPPTQVLLGMFVNVINAPIQGMAIVLSQIAEQKEA